MKKRNLLISLLSLALVAVIGVGATLAYFTDKTDVKNNVFTTGMVDITLTDTSDSEKATETETGIFFDEVMPGDLLDKNVYITVDKDSAPAYVGAFVSVDYSHFGRPEAYDVMGLVNDAMMRAGTMNNWNTYSVSVGGTDGVLYVYNQVVVGVLGGNAVDLTAAQGWQFFGAAMPMAIAGLVSGIAQGKTAVGAIHMTGKQPDASGKGITMTALVETYAILALLTSILLIYGIQL